jgi:hypothetical protein
MHGMHTERRSGPDRRHLSVSAFWHGARFPRRRQGRRAADQLYPIVDWHSPRVFAWVIGVLLLCVADGVLTIFLTSHGAVEVNPLMALFVPDHLHLFAAVKLLLTGCGVLVLVTCSRMKLFRAIPGELLLALICVAYFALVAYELRLVESLHT